MQATRLLSGAAIAASLLIITAGAARIGAQAPRAIPRLPDGRPNLQGVWQVRNRASYDLQDHVSRYLMPAGRSVVDACCGSGGNALGFARAGSPVTAIELAPERLAEAQHNARVYAALGLTVAQLADLAARGIV